MAMAHVGIRHVSAIEATRSRDRSCEIGAWVISSSPRIDCSRELRRDRFPPLRSPPRCRRRTTNLVDVRRLLLASRKLSHR
ncbi:hypothetical protein TIFTF001_006488 [Ficus carica]|uniref:Uncharacterized protein n=1 Tax=Ficus carica TaxID=3494 RepID=A0AA88CW29_FICCA|nr:hypothetical protein TIFTF001_006488 [Ficus carica]